MQNDTVQQHYDGCAVVYRHISPHSAVHLMGFRIRSFLVLCEWNCKNIKYLNYLAIKLLNKYIFFNKSVVLKDRLKQKNHFFKFIKKCKNNKNDINSNITTNDEIIELWKQFKKVKVGFSIDAVGDRNYYIRYPSDWATIEKNLHKLDNTSSRIQVNIAFALQILNIKHVPDFIKWKVSSGFKKLNFDTNAAGQVSGGGICG